MIDSMESLRELRGRRLRKKLRMLRPDESWGIQENDTGIRAWLPTMDIRPEAVSNPEYGR